MNMSYVKAWRTKAKKKIVDLLGGGCCVCGYNRTVRALDAHHIDPDQKSFSMARIMTNPAKWEVIGPELEKCVLLCKNCHAEVHGGLAAIPSDATRYKYEPEEAQPEEMTVCPICEGPMKMGYITCSPACGGKKRWRVNWDEIDLEALLESGMSLVAIGEQLGVSDQSVRKRALKMGLI